MEEISKESLEQFTSAVTKRVAPEEKGFEKLKVEDFEDLALQEDLRLAILDVMNGLKIEINGREN